MADDGSCNQLREKSYEKTVIQETFFFRLVLMAIHQKGNLLEGIEADGQREAQTEQLELGITHCIDGLQKEIGILEIAEQQQIENDAGPQECLSLPRLAQSAQD